MTAGRTSGRKRAFTDALARALEWTDGAAGAYPRVAIALAFAALFACLAAALAEFDYLHVVGVPREEAIVVSQRDDGYCGKGSIQVIATVRVTSSRPGFPNEFTVSDCGPSYSVGDRLIVARKGPGPRPSAELDPPGSEWEVAAIAAVFGAIGFALALAYQLTRDGAWWLLSYRSRRRRAPSRSAARPLAKPVGSGESFDDLLKP